MDKEDLLKYINEELVINGKFYSNLNIHSQISNAIYTYGDNVKYILGFIDASAELDGSKGVIIAPDKLCFKLGTMGVIEYSKINYLGLEKHHNNPNIKVIIKSANGSYAFSNKVINPEKLVELLSKITDIDVDMIMSDYEKVAYYVQLVLDDLKNDEYEDMELTAEQNNLINELSRELQLVENLAEEDYQYELKNICKRSLLIFDEFGLDSDEIDILIEIEEKFNQKDQEENQKIDNAKQFYDDMMSKYQQGDSEMYDRVKNIMSSLGINEADLVGKSTEEIQDFMCEKFGISKSMFEKLAKRFNQ